MPSPNRCNQSAARSPTKEGLLRRVFWAYICARHAAYTLTFGRFRLPRSGLSSRWSSRFRLRRRSVAVWYLADLSSALIDDPDLSSSQDRSFERDERLCIFFKIISRCAGTRFRTASSCQGSAPRVWRPALRGSRPRSLNRNTGTPRNWSSADEPVEDGADWRLGPLMSVIESCRGSCFVARIVEYASHVSSAVMSDDRREHVDRFNSNATEFVWFPYFN